jgi:hypothetical protein
MVGAASALAGLTDPAKKADRRSSGVKNFAKLLNFPDIGISYSLKCCVDFTPVTNITCLDFMPEMGLAKPLSPSLYKLVIKVSMLAEIAPKTPNCGC